ncbi:helix-hairpin-helix domain-containing protein [Candidatus Daviesbacteria bacterium]|nr:helix-hairpin-helix domain-containing protein [Candidatus Daviesbacteria bacterium]
MNSWREKISQFKIPIALGLVGMVLITGGIFTSGINKQKPKSFPKESMVNQKLISVDVSGAVKTPGVYQLNEGSRIEEAVKAAGGFGDGANQEYISKYLNMAQKVSDGSKIYIPGEGEQGSVTSKESEPTFEVDKKVNINTASQSELEDLDGIGVSRASNIISSRPYNSVGDLVSKKVIPQSVFEKIKDQLVIY